MQAEDFGEFELIDRVRERLRERGVDAGETLVLGSGDDAAITDPGGRAVATTVDAFVDGVHFRLSAAPPESIGRKALAGTLSDLAAMGAEPGEAYVTIGIPPEVGEDICLAIVDGVVEGAARWGVALAGGDVTRAPALTLAMTAVGYADAVELLVTRSGAETGDAVVVTGALGGAAAGLLLLERPGLAGAVEPEVAAALEARQLEPQPRIAEGHALAAIGAGAMIDISDGIAGDAAHIAAESGVRLVIDASAVPAGAGVDAVAEAAGIDPLQIRLGGGEDYELLACVAAARLDAADQELVSKLTRIGEVRAGSGVEFVNAGVRGAPEEGFDHLRRAAGDGPS